MAESNETPEVAEAEETKNYLSEAETVGPCKVSVKITIPAATVDSELDERFQEIIKTVAFPGFRTGHTPRRLVERKLGDEIRNDVREHVISESFKAAVEKHDLEPITDPDVDLESITLERGTPIEYSAIFIVKPTVTVPEFDGITVEAVKAEVSDSEVDEVIGNMRRQQAVLEPRDGPFQEEDIAVVGLTVRVGDEKILDDDNYEYHHPSTLLRMLRIDKLPEEILGKTAGDELELTDTLPETWPKAELQGKDFVAQLKVHEVKHRVLPELDETFAENLDYDSIEELREDIHDKVRAQAERGAVEQTDQRIVEALIAAAPFELPEDVIKEEIGNRIERIQASERMRGASDEEVDAKVAEASNSARDEIEMDFRRSFLMEAIAKQEKIFVTETETEERIAMMAGSYGRTVEEMQQYLDQRGLLGSIRSSMREEKVLETLRKKVKIEGAE